MAKTLLLLIVLAFCKTAITYNDCTQCNCCKNASCDYYGKCIDGCIQGYFGYGCRNSCQPNCKSCSSYNYCSSCIDGKYSGYYPDGPYTNWYNDCRHSCKSNCKSCTSYNHCTSCIDGKYSGYYHDGPFTNWYNDCRHSCKSNCKSCTSYNRCTLCIDGKYSGRLYDIPENTVYDDCRHDCYKYCRKCKSYYECSECLTGRYGQYCQNHCPNGCMNNMCDKQTGNCKCLRGFSGTQCNECAIGYYGTNCNNICHGCINSVCLRDGRCKDGCREGFIGEMCDKCEPGKYSDYCNLTCHSECERCTSISACISCKNGFFGPQCQSHCPKNCENCNSQTKCLSCKDGFYGKICSAACPINCNNKICQKDNGACFSCILGFHGSHCEIKCPQNCANNTCNADGTCNSCEGDFTNVQRNCECTKSLCFDTTCSYCNNFTYYVDNGGCCPCSRTCKNRECKTALKCSNGCEDGYHGDDCSSLCDDFVPLCAQCVGNNSEKSTSVVCLRCLKGNYLEKKFNRCNACSSFCRNNTCNEVNGTCTQGCIDRRWGYNCENKCISNCLQCQQTTEKCLVCEHDRYLSNCFGECSETCNSTEGVNACDINNGTCLYGCSSPNKYGTICENSCSSNCTRKECDWKTGQCLNGCITGHYGKTCENLCSTMCIKADNGSEGSECDETTGYCKVGCRDGWYGNLCNKKCGVSCVNEICSREFGTCLNGCIDGYKGSTCSQASGGSEANSKTAITVGVGAVCLVFTIIGIITIVFLIKRRNKKAKGKSDDTEEIRYGNAAVTFSEVRASEVETTETNAVYAKPIKPRKREFEESMTLNKPNSETATIKETTADDIDDKRRHLRDETKVIRGKQNCIQPQTEKPRSIYKNSYLRQSTHRNSGTQHKSPKSTNSVLEIEEDLSIMVQTDESSITEKEKEVDYTYYNVADMIKRKVPLEKLAEHVSKMTKEDFAEEFNKLPPGLIKPYTESQKKGNKTKNRYKGIYPYDQTRVILTGGKSDYINASFIDGFQKRKEYIASIGPTYKYMGDMSSFWKMVWQQNVGKIVMLTKLCEAGETKCNRYWPETDGCMSFEDICVSANSEVIYADYTIRSFSVQKNSEVRRIVQAHFTAWPDKGTPDDVTSLVQFREKVNSIKTYLIGPILVHCSAGIGRTGTYIAIDSITQEGETNGAVDIYACVRNLREQRVSMIQTTAQYKYLHFAVVHTLTFDSKPIKASEFNDYMSSRTVALLERQFQQLQASTENRTDEELETVRMNKTLEDKNRSIADIPGNNNRPRLYLRRTKTISGYINAMYINGFRTVNRFLVAQTPLPNTVEDFLTLIVQEKVSCVVAMETSLSTNETVGSYYPVDKQILRIGSVTVQSANEEHMDHYVKKELKISYQGKSVKEEVQVTHIQYTRWNEKKKLPDDPKIFMQFVRDVDKICDGTRNKGPILVHCLTGAETSGLFCVVSILLEKIHVDQEVSVVNTVCQVKNRRHKSIPNKEQYIFCHQCLDEYLHTFDTYSNFCLAK